MPLFILFKNSTNFHYIYYNILFILFIYIILVVKMSKLEETKIQSLVVKNTKFGRRKYKVW